MLHERQRKMVTRNRVYFSSLAVVFVLAAPLHTGNNSVDAFAVVPAAAGASRTRRQTILLQMTAAVPTSTTNQTETILSNTDETYGANLEIAKLASLAPKNATAALAAHRLLQELPHPDTVTYNGVLKAHAKSPSLDGAQRAQDLLEEMEETHRLQSRANQEWYLEMHNMTEFQLQQGAPRITVKPNVRSYSTVMDAWSRRSGKVPQGAAQAQAVLERLEQLYATTDDKAFQPNTIAYNTVIAAWAKDGGQADKAQLLLERMGHLADVISHNAVLLAWARSGLPNAGERAEALLREMKIVNARSYTTVIDAWSRSHPYNDESGERAYALLHEMEELYETTGDASIRPNCISYSTVINAYALSKDPNKALKAWNILQRMRKLNDSGENVSAKPSLITYNSVLNACATSSPSVHLQVKQMVHSLYQEIMSNPFLHADHFTYGTGMYFCEYLLQIYAAFTSSLKLSLLFRTCSA